MSPSSPYYEKKYHFLMPVGSRFAQGAVYLDPCHLEQARRQSLTTNAQPKAEDQK
jgi:hypothetical protein